MNIQEIINNPKLQESRQMVLDINDDMIGRVALNQAAQATHILYIIRELMGDKCKKVLDIGTLWGGSMITMMQSEYESHFVSIDLFDGYYKASTGLSEDPVCGGTNTIDSVTKNINKHNKHNHSYDLVEGSSHDSEVIKKVHSLVENSVDILFIDGDHTKKGVLEDWNDYSPLVAKGGIIVFDDHWSGELAQYAWRHKDHWTEPKAMDIVGAFKEISEDESFKDNWVQIGLIEDKMIIERI